MACNQLSCLTSAAVRAPAESTRRLRLQPQATFSTLPRYRNVPARNASSALALLGVLCTTCQRGRHSPQWAVGAAETDNRAHVCHHIAVTFAAAFSAHLHSASSSLNGADARLLVLNRFAS
jgi:hypothetical protein